MASLFLRRRLSPSRSILSDYRESDRLPWGLKFGTLRPFSSSGVATQVDFTDLTQPHTWYPCARRKSRNVILHVGPTNSGKTHHALKQLESSSSGVYCGPLRLLAWEVAKRLNKAKVPCDLITGQEREEVDGAQHKAVTVEMADVTSDYDCAVIDEIQMLGCRTRGFSFTRAILGISANELHLCGDAAAVPLIQEILKVTGDNFKVQHYDRLLPLVPLKVPLGSFSNIETGDCIVTFSRRMIYRLKKQIENGGKHLCSVVYGSLPPETRTRQATMFNDASSEFDVLVASDAIGMGLNLNISRIIFSTLMKFDGMEHRQLTIPEIKQIAGRAGRYGSKFPFGEVTCLDREDLPLVHSALDSPSPIIERAGLFPNFDLLYMFSRLHPEKSLHQILEHFAENAKLSANYFIANCEDMLKVAAIIDELPLGLHDKFLFCIRTVYRTRVPTEMRDGATRADELRRRLTEADEGSTEAGGAPTKTDEVDEGSTRQTEADEGWRKMKELRRRLEEADEGWRSFDAETMVTEEGQRRLRKMKQSPVDVNDEISFQGLTQFAQNYAKNGIVRLREIFTPGTLQVPKTPTALQELESIHKVLDLYVWLSFRLEDSFPDRELASSQKALCSMLIEEFLERFGWQKPNARILPRRTSLSSMFAPDVRQHVKFLKNI